MTQPLLSLAAGVLPEFAPHEIVRAACEAGYRACGIWFDAKTWTAATTTLVHQALADGQLVPLDIEVIWIRAGRTPSDDARRLIAVGGELGARNVLIVSANPDALETTHQFAAMCELAHAAGMRAVLEFLMISEVKTLQQALDIVTAVNHPAAGLLIDALHLQRCGASPTHVRAIDRRLLPYAQLCDAPNQVADVSYQGYLTDAVDGRSAAGEGELPLRDLIAALPANAPLSLEVRSKAYRDRFPRAVDRASAVRLQTARYLSSIGLAP